MTATTATVIVVSAVFLALGIAAVVAFRKRQSPVRSPSAIDDHTAITLGRFSVLADRLEGVADRLEAAEQEKHAQRR